MFRRIILFITCWLYGSTFRPEDSAVLAAENSAIIAQELRVVWGGSTPRAFQGSIAIEDGTIKIARNLSMQESAIGAMFQKDANTVELNSAGPTTFGGLDIAIRAGSSSKLRIRMQDGLSGKAFDRVVNVVDLQQKNWIEPLDDSGSRIAIERQVYDRLRVETANNDNGIFESGSIWSPSISGIRTGIPAGDYHLIGAWAGRGNAHVIDTPIQIDSQGNFAAFKPELKIPAAEGAQRLDLSIVKPNIMATLAGNKSLLTRSVDLLAFSPDAAISVISSWHAVMAVDTAAAIKPEGFSWLTSFTGSLASRAIEVPEKLGLPSIDLTEQINKLIPFSKSVTNFGAVGKGGQLSVRDFRVSGASSAQRTAVIAPGSWISLPLTGMQIGKAHRLRIQIPIDHPSCLSVSVRDGSSETGENLLDPQVCVEIKPEDCTDGATTTHDFVFWPKSESTSVLVASGSRTKTGLVGKILVEAAEYTSRPANPVPASPHRDVAIYLDQPLLVDCFSAPREKDPVSGRWLESWKTWQSVAERIVMQMQLAGANTLVLTGVSNGNSIVPQQSPLQLHRLDKGTFFTDGRAPEMHDVVDLLLYHFDRAGLKLILEVEPSPSTQVQQNALKPEELAQLDLLNLDGMTSARDVGTVRLNPLNRKVEQANFDPLRELTRKYGRHQAFGGLSLRLNANSQYLFVGDRWGYNEELLKQFSAESNLVIPKDSNQMAQLLSGPARFRYINWRAKQLTNAFGKLAQTLPDANQHQKLYLNVMHLVNRAPSETDFVDPDTVARNQQQLLQCYGIDSDVVANHKKLALIQGGVRQAKQAISSAEWFRNGSLESSEPLKNQHTQPSILITHQPKSMKLAADSEKPKQPELWIYPDAARSNKAAKRILLEQMWKQDPVLLGVGGWQPIWSTDAEVQRFIESLSELPPIVMQDSNALPADAPLKIRSAVFQDQAFVYILNLSRWELSLQLMTAKSPQNVEVIGDTNDNLVEQTGTGLSLRVPASELIALRSTDVMSLEIRSANYQLPDTSLESTAQRLEQFEALLAHSADPGQQEVLFGLPGSFEQWNNNKPVGWNVSTLPNTFIQRAAELPRSGNYSIQIENRNADLSNVWIQSAPIELPATGRLTLRAWLRASAADQAQPQVRLGLVGRFANGGRYQRSVIYGSGQSDPARNLSIDWGRRPAELHVSDIPVDDLVELQVAIDLIGPGRIWIDDVEVVQSWLHPDERNYLRGQVLVVKEKLNSKNPFAADRLLQSPWSDYLFDLGNKLGSGQAKSQVPAPEANRADWNKSKPTLQQFRESMRQRWNR